MPFSSVVKDCYSNINQFHHDIGNIRREKPQRLLQGQNIQQLIHQWWQLSPQHCESVLIFMTPDINCLVTPILKTNKVKIFLQGVSK